MMQSIANWLISRADRRLPDYVIGGEDNPYLRRWWLIPRNPLFNVYLHQILRSDDDRALHTHPWVNCSVILQGQYTEHMVGKSVVRKANSIVARWSGHIAHRLEITDGPCWTLFITGPRYKQWHFCCPQGLVHWKAFTRPGKPGEIGAGCDQ